MPPPWAGQGTPFPFPPLLVLTCALAWREFDLGQRQHDLPQMPDTRCWVSTQWHPMVRDALHRTGPQEVCLGAGELCWLENSEVSQSCMGSATGICPICQSCVPPMPAWGTEAWRVVQEPPQTPIHNEGAQTPHPLSSASPLAP